MRTGARQKRAWTAILAAFLLLAHSAVAGFAAGAMAEPQLVDAFGNPICSAHGGGGPSSLPGQPGDHAHALDCCLAGCGATTGYALAPAAQPVLLVRLAGPAPAVPHDYRPVTRVSGRSPLNPRAPPPSSA